MGRRSSPVPRSVSDLRGSAFPALGQDAAREAANHPEQITLLLLLLPVEVKLQS